MSKFNVGDKVKYIGTEHDISPQWFPIVGTTGTVVEDVDEVDCYIQWPKGSTSREDRWYCNKNDIELVENVDMTNEEIWKMLENKMRKNGFHYSLAYDKNNVEYEMYSRGLVFDLIAIAYRSGYERAMKGRPFKIGEKKKKCGHWEPVNPNNLPKEGTRVRYARESEEYTKEPGMIDVGDIGVFSYGKILGLPGIRFDDGNWISFSNEIDCLDMWVEDDE